MMTKQISPLAKEIRRRRLAKGWSQRRLMLEAEAQSVPLIERGDRTDPQISVVARVAAALGCTIDELVKGAVRRRGRE